MNLKWFSTMILGFIAMSGLMATGMTWQWLNVNGPTWMMAEYLTEHTVEGKYLLKKHLGGPIVAAFVFAAATQIVMTIYSLCTIHHKD